MTSRIVQYVRYDDGMKERFQQNITIPVEPFAPVAPVAPRAPVAPVPPVLPVAPVIA
jgi:hypothetical protein